MRKDLATVSAGGRPKLGYVTKDLIADIKTFLGYNDKDSAVVVGAGNLGSALMNYQGFKEYGLHIVAAFDNRAELCAGKKVFAMSRLKDLCLRLNVHVGIITVPGHHAQQVCDLLVDSGILAIWNFAPVHLNVPEHVIVQNENMAASLALLSKHLLQRLYDRPTE